MSNPVGRPTNESQFYVYMYLCPDNIPFYIGKGKGYRWNTCNHSVGHTGSKIKNIGRDNVKIKFLHINLSEKEALNWESYWIDYIGRRDLNKGTLTNHTNGGEIGPTGSIPSQETRKKMSDARKGKKLSAITKARISKSNIGNPAHQYRKGKKFGPLSIEHKQKLSDARMGKSPWNKGIPQSDKTKIKNSISNGKLTPDNVKFIRRNRNKYTSKELSNMFGVSTKTIYLAATYKQWRHVKDE